MRFKPNVTPAVRQLALAAALFCLATVLSMLANAVLDPRVTEATTCSNPQKQWVWREPSLAAYGIDAYLHHPSGTLSDPDCNFLAHFISQSGTSGRWVQVGLTIGPLPTGGYVTTYKIYSDGVDHCGAYNFVNHGSPTSSNQAYYINYTGSSGSDGCGSWYKFDIRKDDWYNQPIWYRYNNVSNQIWVAENEALKQTSTWPDTGQAWWGHETSSSWPLAYGLAWYDYSGGTWNEWTSTQGGTSYYSSDPNGQSQQYRWCVDSINRAHHSLKGASC